MTPVLSELRSAVIDRMATSEVRWRAVGVLFLAGAMLTLFAALSLPIEPGGRQGPVVGIAVAALLGGAVMTTLPRRLPAGDTSIAAALGVGTVLITGTVFFSNTQSAPYAAMYVWVAFMAFSFVSRRAAYQLLTLVGACYAGMVIALPGTGGGMARWLMIVGTVAATGILTDILRQRSDHLVRRLVEMARTDPLTGLLNRRGFGELVANELERARRAGQKVSLVVADLDHFKTVNDRFGHQAGDRALEMFSELARATARRIDGAGRMGGEEFAFVLPDTNPREAHIFAERLRHQVRANLSVQGLALTVSIGIATATPTETAEQLLHSADQAMYLAKHLGRDRSVVYYPALAKSLRNTESVSVMAQHLPAVLVLAEMLDLRTGGSTAHSKTVARLAEATASHLGMDASRVERVCLAGLLHDVGKLGVPDLVLRKRGRLSDAEWVEMRRHPELGSRLLAGASLDDVSAWVLAHHERPDGAGYPFGLQGSQIPLEAKILAVADAFEAMTSDRADGRGMPVEEAVAELERHAGSQFDPRVVQAFVAAMRSPMAPLSAAPPGEALDLAAIRRRAG